MIQFYKKDNTNFEMNGEIAELTSCVLSLELNGVWKLSIEAPYSESSKDLIINDNVVVIDTPTQKKQRYRIYDTEVSDDEMSISAEASPIFLDAAGEVFLMDQRPTGKNGQQALDILTNGTEFSGESDIETQKTAYYVRKNLIEALASSDENSFLNVWGGEIIYDNKKVYINKKAGGDYGVRAEFGHNLVGLKATESFADIVTRIVPESYNGHTLLEDDPFVESPLIDEYATKHTKVIQYSHIKLKEDAQEGEEDVIVCENMEELYEELKKAAEAEFEAGVDKPKVNYACDMVELAKYDEYKDFKDLVRVWLGDTVHCSNKNVGINVDARCIKLTYDCIREEVTSVELGNFTENFLGNVTSGINSVNNIVDGNGNVMAEKILGIINAGKTKLRAQRTIAQKQDVRAILFEDLDPDSPTYGAMSLGTAGFEIADKRTADNRDWDWSTFGTAKGFSADLITAGTLAAIDILGVNITGSIIEGGTVKGAKIIGNDIEGGTIKGSTIKGVTIKNEAPSNPQQYTQMTYGMVSAVSSDGKCEMRGGRISVSEPGVAFDFAEVLPGRIVVTKGGKTVFDTDNL